MAVQSGKDLFTTIPATQMMRKAGEEEESRSAFGTDLFCADFSTNIDSTWTLYFSDLNDDGIDAKLGAAGKLNEFERLKQDNIDTIVGYGDNFMGLVCRDACDGHDVGRVGGH